jgi:hypothetical protein
VHHDGVIGRVLGDRRPPLRQFSSPPGRCIRCKC